MPCLFESDSILWMEINRRQLFTVFTGMAACAVVPRHMFASAADRLYLAARATSENEYRMTGFDETGKCMFDFQLPARGHSFAVHPNRREIVHFARRPGRFGIVIDPVSKTEKRWLPISENRHFYGHGVFSSNGKFLYASENDFTNERGVIGVYDADHKYQRIQELDSHGIEPHEINLLSDDRTLVSANGGILTHPSLPRVKLNIPEMRSSLCFIDRINGNLIEEHRLSSELQQLSIRHLAISSDDTVAVAMQYQGPKQNIVPLVATLSKQESGAASASRYRLKLLQAPSDVLRAMKQYCGDVRFDSSGQIIAVTSPRGDIITFWNISTFSYMNSVRLTDCCGISQGTVPGQFVVSSGAGVVAILNALTDEVKELDLNRFRLSRWDNHLSATSIQ